MLLYHKEKRNDYSLDKVSDSSGRWEGPWHGEEADTSASSSFRREASCRFPLYPWVESESTLSHKPFFFFFFVILRGLWDLSSATRDQIQAVQRKP